MNNESTAPVNDQLHDLRTIARDLVVGPSLRPSRDLVDLGRRMMTSPDEETGWSKRRRAVHYRDGLMIALMAYRPFRRKNFPLIVLGVHLVQQSGVWWLQFPTSRTKAKRPYEVAFPAALVPELERYLAVHRKVLLAGESGQLSPSTDALWVSEVGTMLEEGALRTESGNILKGRSARPSHRTGSGDVGDAQRVLGTPSPRPKSTTIRRAAWRHHGGTTSCSRLSGAP